MKKYYDIRTDIAKYPEAWCYIVYSKRGPGKTYSSLRMVVEDKIPFIFMKRTIDDVKLLCAGSGKIGSKMSEFGVDLSPFVPLNRDFGWNIRPFNIQDGLAGFWHCDVENNPIGTPIGYAIACTAVTKYKGFDMSIAQVLIYDEFIPQPWDRVNKKEGEQILDLYMTISRDKKKRGLPELKLLALANATSITNPLFNVLELTDIAADMNVTGAEYYYNEDKQIMMHQLPADFDVDEETEQMGIEKAMADTDWGAMAFGGKFGYNDFSSVGKRNLKQYQPVVGFKYKHSEYYIYRKDGYYYCCKAKNYKCTVFDLNRENEQKKFYYDYVIDLRDACIDDKMTFENYSTYDIIVNYKKYFTL